MDNLLDKMKAALAAYEEHKGHRAFEDLLLMYKEFTPWAIKEIERLTEELNHVRD